MRVYAIAYNTFREAVRDKVLYVLLFFAAVAILGSKALGWVSIGQDIKIVKDISLAATSLFGMLIAIFVGTNMVYTEIQKRTIYTILSCPIRRYEFILGKYFGLSALLALVTTAMTSVTIIYLLLLGGKIDVVFCEAVLLIYFELLLVTAMSVLMSSLASPILGAIIVFSMYVLGHATNILINLPGHFTDTYAEYIMKFAYYIIPNLSNFNIRAEAANSVSVSGQYVIWTICYGILYTTMLLIVSALAFQDKDV